jgi:hypothetical protein
MQGGTEHAAQSDGAANAGVTQLCKEALGAVMYATRHGDIVWKLEFSLRQ